MTRSNLFSKHYKSTDTQNNISIQGAENTAQICFTNAQVKAELALLPFERITEEPLFNDRTNFLQFNLINTWMINYGAQRLILYSGSRQPAFLYTTTTENAIDEFMHLIEINAFKELDFMIEKRFDTFCRDMLKMNLQQLKTLPGMDRQSLTALLTKKQALAGLIRQGITAEQIITTDPAVLNRLLDTTQTLEDLRKKPADAPRISICFRCLGTNTNCSFTGETFSYRHEKDKLVITHQNNTQFTLTIHPANPQPGTLRHNAHQSHSSEQWVFMKETIEQNQITRTYYSPTRSEMIEETYDEQFPIALLKIHFRHLLMGVSRYNKYRAGDSHRLFKNGSDEITEDPSPAKTSFCEPGGS